MKPFHTFISLSLSGAAGLNISSHSGTLDPCERTFSIDFPLFSLVLILSRQIQTFSAIHPPAAAVVSADYPPERGRESSKDEVRASRLPEQQSCFISL